VATQRRLEIRPRRRALPDIGLHEPSIRVLWGKLALTATEVSRLSGISRRQVEWWRHRGYLVPSPEHTDRFTGEAVTLALLIKQGLDAGLPLRTAYQLATRHIAVQLAEGLAANAPEGGDDSNTLAELEQKLLVTQNTIGLVLDVIAPLVRRAERAQ
jgi:DNA-binding transcriptional MerR regulator